MKIYLGTDHNGFHLKEALLEYLRQNKYKVIDVGNTKLDPNDDFPIFATQVVTDLLASGDPEPKGILICGSGQGMCIAANRYKGIRASLAWDRESARTARNDDDSNILCIPARSLKEKEVFEIVETWLETPFAAAPRFIRRLKEIDEIS